MVRNRSCQTRPSLLVLALAMLLGTVQAQADLDLARADVERANTVLERAADMARQAAPEAIRTDLDATIQSFLDTREDRARAAARLEPGVEAGNEEDAISYWYDLLGTTNAMTRWLRGHVYTYCVQPEHLGTWEGVWVDGQGGYLEVLDMGDRVLAFRLEAVRGPTLHTGLIEGVALVNAGMQRARFAVPDPSSEDRALTIVTFDLQHGRLHLSTVNAESFHGARAYFDGTYVRTRELPRDAVPHLKALGQRGVTLR